jgi:hypothetical protein
MPEALHPFQLVMMDIYADARRVRLAQTRIAQAEALPLAKTPMEPQYRRSELRDVEGISQTNP